MNSPEILSRTLAYLAAAVVAAPIAKRLGLGSVLGYIIAGAVIGPSALSLIGDPTEVGHVAEFGVVMLMFLIGLEMRPSLLWQLRSAIFGLGIGQMLLSASLMTAIGLVLGLAPAVAAAVSLILAMSSTALVLSTLEEKGQRAQPIGQA
ncbi:MAG: cation:proton antiporter domain-containing protein, partial [Sphingomonas oligoaromativorans]